MDLYLWESLVALRIPWTLRTFRLVVVVGGAACCLVLWTVSALVAHALLDMNDPGLALTVAVTASLTLTYLASAHVVRDLLSGLNPATRHDPRHALLKALDLPIATVAIVYALAPRLPVAVAGTGVVGALYLPLREQLGLTIPELVLVLTAPSLLALAGATLVAASAITRVERGLPRLRTVLTLGLISLAVGGATGEVVSGLVLVNTTDPEPRSVLAWMPPASVVLAAVSAACVVRLVRHRPDRVAVPGASDVGRRSSSRSAATMMIRGLLAEVVAAPTFPVVRNTVVGLLCLGLGLTGASLAGLSLTDLPTTQVRTVMLTVVVTMIMALCEALSRPVGPIRLAPVLRQLWELGAERGQLAVVVLAAYALPVGTSLVLSTLAYALVTGTLSIAPALAHLIGLAAWVIAECVVPPVTNADGSAMYNAVTGVAILTMTAPVLLVVLHPSVVVDVLLCAYSLLLSGGAFTCLSNRVLHMPSVSAR
ncbi:hypothetical protein [Nocardioides sp.]|uniref:hypothetical protein n=1 Tax=Nocardioides sp. TaxID=35761 RepID=UPI003D117836